jgi:hypothetical protein
MVVLGKWERHCACVLPWRGGGGDTEPLWRSERSKRYVMARAHFLSPTYSNPTVWHGFSLHVNFPLPSHRVGSESRFYCRWLVLFRARETVARVLPASEGTHIEILFWLVFQIAFRRSARWLGKDGGFRRCGEYLVNTDIFNINHCFLFKFKLVSDFKGGTYTEGVWEQDIEENIWTTERWSERKL